MKKKKTCEKMICIFWWSDREICELSSETGET